SVAHLTRSIDLDRVETVRVNTYRVRRFGRMQDFQKLIVWRRARALGLRVDVAIRAFPRGKSATVQQQLGRAAESLAASIVEGAGEASQRRRSPPLDIAIKSSSETQ